MQYTFTKMHGLGNDFMVLNFVHQVTPLPTETIQALANRKTGIGFDQLLIVEASTEPEFDFRYRIYNADGGEVEHCGNGIRCVANFILEQNISQKHQLNFQLPNGSITTELLDNHLVKVNMQAPIFEPVEIPFQADKVAITYPLEMPDGLKLDISALSMGNPHAVLLVDNIDSAPLKSLGPLIENHHSFPKRVNAGFMEIVNPNNIRLRVYERGTGETLACGTGACAAVVAGQQRGLLAHTVAVELKGGQLTINWEGEDSSVFMTGPATTVFEGKIEL